MSSASLASPSHLDVTSVIARGPSDRELCAVEKLFAATGVDTRRPGRVYDTYSKMTRRDTKFVIASQGRAFAKPNGRRSLPFSLAVSSLVQLHRPYKRRESEISSRTTIFMNGLLAQIQHRPMNLRGKTEKRLFINVFPKIKRKIIFTIFFVYRYTSID